MKMKKEFVGAEYLIAKMLIEKNEPVISTAALNRLGVYVRRLSIEEGVDAVFLTSREEVYSAIYDYSDYFECVYEENRLNAIKIKEGKGIEDLNEKFMQCLPEYIMKVLDDAIRELAA